jgi:hypothetical protein
MEEARWRLALVAQHATDPAAILAHIPCADVDAIIKKITAPPLPLDIVTAILSHVDLKSVKAVMRVCKQWYQASRRHDFWKHHIRAAILRSHRCDGITLDQVTRAAASVDTFASPRAETLREQVGWIFLAASWSSSWNAGNSSIRPWIRFIRSAHTKSSYECAIYTGTGKVKFRSWSTQVREVMVYECPLVEIKHIDVDYQNNHGVIVSNTWHFEGQVRDKRSDDGDSIARYIPHGNGTWTFADGRVLNGPNVAFDGKPVWPEKDDGASVKRRKKNAK